MDPLANIGDYLADVRRRWRVVVVARDGCFLLSTLALLLLLLLLIAAMVDLRTAFRVLGGILAAGAILTYGLHGATAWRRLGKGPVVAGLVGAKRPVLRSDLISTVQLERELESGTARFSRVLFEALASRTWIKLQKVPARCLVPASLLTPMTIMLVATLLAWAIAVAAVPDLVGRGAARVLSASFARGRVASMVLVGDLKLHYQYPRHMGRPNQVVKNSTGHILAPKGTRIRIQASTLAPVSGASLMLQMQDSRAESRMALAVKENRKLIGDLTISREGLYRFEIQLPDGRVVLDPVEHRIHLEEDASPRANLYGPEDDLEVTAQHRLEVGYAVEDDYGLTKVELVYQADSSPPKRTTLWKHGSTKRRRTATGKQVWDLASVDLHPGARVAYWIEAWDNDTISGPKAGRSTALHFTVYSAEKKHAEILRLYEQLVEQALRILADRLLLFATKPTIGPSLQVDKTQSINRSHGSLVDGLRELRNRMRKDRLAPEAHLRTISQMHQRMGGLLKTESQALKTAAAARRRGQVRPTHLGPLKERNRKLVVEMERDVLLLVNLLDEQRLQGLMTMSRNLSRARKRLAELLRRYRKTRSEKLRQEIARQIRQMERQIEQLMAKLARLNASIPDEYLNQEALLDLDLRKDLRRISQMVAQGKMAQLEASLRALEQKLQQMRGLLADNLHQFRRGRTQAAEQAYSAMLDQIRQMEIDQRQIARRTRRVIRRYHQRAAALMKHRINPFVRREMKKLARLRKRVNEIDSANLAPYDQEQLERVKQRVKDLRGMLDQGDLDEALRMALRTRNGLQVLQDDLSEEVEGQYSRKRRRLLRTLKRTRGARKIADELVADLKSIFPHPRSLLDQDDRRKLRRLVRRQRSLRRTVHQFASKLEKTFKRAKTPLGKEITQGLDESSDLMGKAGNKLRRLQPQEAHGAQEAAAERLARLRKQAQEARQPRQWSQAGPSVMRERIKIPGADAFRPPKEFRKDILDAMKEKPPASYEKQVKRYYKELVR